MIDDAPAGLNLRREGSTTPSDPDRAADVAALLTVHDGSHGMGTIGMVGRGRGRSYREARLEPGDPVTIVGRALPFSDLDDPADADTWTGPNLPADDPEVVADIAAARANGTLTDDPADAWGNAAIQGFGIARPVTEPVLDPGANPLRLAEPGEAVRVGRVFDIAPETLILAASGDVPLLVAFGTPAAVEGRGQARFVYGLLGAIVAIGSAMVFAVSLDGLGS
jgi:hypothetical protein